MEFLVRNVNGSSRFDAPSGYSSWLEYWEAHSGQKASSCHNISCYGTNLVGAHVQKVNSYDTNWYIAAVCSSCNQKTTSYTVIGPLVPVPSNL